MNVSDVNIDHHCLNDHIENWPETVDFILSKILVDFGPKQPNPKSFSYPKNKNRRFKETFFTTKTKNNIDCSESKKPLIVSIDLLAIISIENEVSSKIQQFYTKVDTFYGEMH